MESVRIKPYMYSKEEVIIAGDPGAMCWIRNIIVAAAKYHEEHERPATVASIRELLNTMYEEQERKE